MFSQLKSMSVKVQASTSFSKAHKAVVIPVTKDNLNANAWTQVSQETRTRISNFLTSDFVSQDREKLSWVQGVGEEGNTHYLLVQVGAEKDLTKDSVRNAFGEACKWVSARGFSSVAFLIGESSAMLTHAKAAVEGALLSSYRFNNYLGDEKLGQTLKEMNFYIASEDVAHAVSNSIQDVMTVIDSVFMARDWSNQPTNVLGPDLYTKQVQDLAKQYNLSCTVLDEQELIKRGMNLVIAVGKASVERPRVIHLEYKPAGAAKTKIALVGKGVMYDTGGLSLKPSASMMGMKMDMSGSACVVATILAAAKLQLPVHIHVVTPVVENAVAGNATRPGDIVKAKNGKCVEIENTDAEGRLILADSLCYAEELGVDYIIDVATLTGACLVALGDEVAAILSSDETMKNTLLECSKKVGEKFWPLPLEENYKKLLKSPAADLKNVGGRNAGTITAALFLKEFVEKAKWAHLDIAGPSDTEKELPICPKGGTGFSTATLVEFLRTLA
ncbi:MAG: leucyl aminopeptidase [Bdellovibrionota bacterium]